MNKEVITPAIVLKRVNYGEYDRILTVITPDNGKLSLIAKGSRKIKSKLSGSIELFSVFEAKILNSNYNLAILVSARSVSYYQNIVKDIARVQLGYLALKTIDLITQDNSDHDFYKLLEEFLILLNNDQNSITVLQNWLKAQLLVINGHTPNLITDIENKKLIKNQTYSIDIENMVLSSKGKITDQDIKILRILFNPNGSKMIFRIEEAEKTIKKLDSTIEAMFMRHLSV